MATQMSKTAALRIRIEPELHKRFIDTCKARELPASQVLREFMKQFVSTDERIPQADILQQTRQPGVD
jgi:antitoxin component of RelBE/YafQ-DinJ toxin-antitoxin module